MEDIYRVLGKEIVKSYGLTEKDFYLCDYEVQRTLLVNYFRRIVMKNTEENEKKYIKKLEK